MNRIYAALILLLILLPFVGSAQTNPAQNPWVGRLREATQRWKELKALKDSLLAAPRELRDSVALRHAIDSIGATGLDSTSVAVRVDSLRKAHGTHQLAAKAQQEAEERLGKEMREIQAAAAGGMVPGETIGLLKELESAVPDFPGKAAPRPKLAAKVFAGSEARMREAFSTMDKYKGRFQKVETEADLTRGLFGLDALKGKPWQERLVLGTLWRFGKGKSRYNLDLAPTLAWRLTDLFSVGAGFQYRLGVDLDTSPMVGGDRVSGYLIFSDYKIKKDFFGRLHYERINAPTGGWLGELEGREWVPGLGLGLGKGFSIFGLFRGFALAQYNLLQNRNTPYLNPLQVLLGVEIGWHRFLKAKKRE